MIGGLIFWSRTDSVVAGSALRAMASRTVGVRATMSAEPPGANGMTIRTGLVG